MTYTTAYFGNICSHSVICHINVSSVKYQANVGHSLTFVDPCIIVQFIKKNATMYQNFIILYLYAQHVSGNTLPVTRSLKLHWQPLVFYTWKVVVRVAGGHCRAQYVPDNVHQLQNNKILIHCCILLDFSL